MLRGDAAIAAGLNERAEGSWTGSTAADLIAVLSGGDRHVLTSGNVTNPGGLVCLQRITMHQTPCILSDS